VTLSAESSAAWFPSSAPAGHSHRVERLLSLPGQRLASLGGNGRVIVWGLGGASAAQAAAWSLAGADKARGLAATTDGAALLCGCNSGDITAFSCASGAKLAVLSPGKVRSPVLACALSDDGRWVLGAYAAGIVARWEVVTAAEEWAGAPAEGGEE